MRIPLIACAVAVSAMSVVSCAARPDPEFRPGGEAAGLGRVPGCDQILAIQVRWLHRTPGPEERAVFQQAAQAWSSRLRAYPVEERPPLVGPLTLVQAGYYVRDGYRVPLTQYVEIDADVPVDDVDGLLVLVDDEWWEPVSTGQPHGWEVDPETGAFRVWLGVVRVSVDARRDLRTITHEIGHVLGLGTAPGYHALVREGPGGAVFAGAHAVAVHGGPVPLEHGHTAPCPSVMTYRGCAVEAPSALDWAMLRDLGYEVVEAPTGPCSDARPAWAERGR